MHGSGIAGMYDDLATPFDCSWLLIAIEPAHFGIEAGAGGQQVAATAERIRISRRRDGVTVSLFPAKAGSDGAMRPARE